MFKKLTAMHEANPALSLEDMARALKADTGMTLKECREWVKAWVMKG